MSFAVCLAQLREQGVIDAKRAERFSAEYERLRAAHAKVLGEIGAVDAASRDVMDALAFQAVNNRRQKLKQVAAQKNILEGLTAFVQNPPVKSMVGDYISRHGKAGQYAIALLDHHEAVPGVSNVDNRRAALAQMAWQRMGGFMDRFSRDLGGKLSRIGGAAVDMKDVVRALKGEAVDSAEAKAIAAAVGDTFEWLRHMFNEAGGSIAKLADWGLPQSHDALSIARAGRDAWKAFIRPMLDVGRMIDHDTGLPFSDARLGEVLDDVWDSITSEGLDKVTPGVPGGSGKMANRRADHRFLHFKSADDWMAYNERFGVGGPFEAIVNHIDGMTREIAAMQILGPNPALTVRWLGDILRQDALPTPQGGKVVKLEKRAARAAKTTDLMWRMYTGALSMPSPANRTTARFFSGLRNWNVASKLGSATMSALGSDPMFLSMTSKFNGLDATRALSNYVQLYASRDMRAAARHAGLVFNEMNVRAEKIWREGEGMRLNMHEASRRLATGVMDASLLAPHTQGAKQALGLGFMMDFADHAAKPFARLDKADQLKFERYGIDADAWDLIRSTPVTDQDGVRMIRPGDVASRADVDADKAFDAAVRIGEMIDSETRLGVPGESLRAQTAAETFGGSLVLDRGTIGGELLRSATQFKTYSIIALMTHWQRMFYGRGGVGRAAYGLTLPLFLTMGGMAVLAMKAIKDGKDPPKMDDWRNWAAAYVQGGGSGMLGDFFQAGLSGRSRTGGTLLGYAAGPTISTFIDPALNLTLGNAGEAAGQMADGKEVDTHLSAEAYKQARGLLPGQNIWYSQIFAHRMALDQLQTIADPNYPQSWARMERAAERRGQPYWWAPGQMSPDRAPDLTAAFGGEDAPAP